MCGETLGAWRNDTILLQFLKILNFYEHRFGITHTHPHNVIVIRSDSDYLRVVITVETCNHNHYHGH